jgi:uncharacterized protein YrzB (UPF0473 family)
MNEKMKEEIINFMSVYFKTVGYRTIILKEEKGNEVIYNLLIPKKRLFIGFDFDKKEIIVVDENGKEFIYDIGLILKSMILLS